MISKKTYYGLKAVVYLTKAYEGDAVLITHLARKEKIPQKFLEAILLELRKSGILQSKKGKGGGYSLAKHPQEIMVGDVIRVLDGPLTPVPVENKKVSEDNEINLIMKEVADAVSHILDKTTLLDLIEKAQKDKNIPNFMI